MKNYLSNKISLTSIEARGVYGSVTAPPIRAGNGVSNL